MAAVDIEGYDANTYLKRIADRECPLPYDSPVFLPARSNPPPPLHPADPVPLCSLPQAPSPEEKERMTAHYYSTAALPASQRFADFPEDGITEILPGRAWVLRLLSPEECQHVIQSGERQGLHGPKGGFGPRTMKRTNDFMFPSLSTLVGGKLPVEMLDLLEATTPYTSVRGLHPNWRVARYEPGEAFPAHYDNSDHITVIAKVGARERYTSSHTLLIYLSDRSSYSGGATRLFPLGRYDEGSVDVELPQGFALVFQQRGMLHAGLAVGDVSKETPAAKYIAQAGVLRGQAEVTAGGAPSLFKFGPGLAGY